MRHHSQSLITSEEQIQLGFWTCKAQDRPWTVVTPATQQQRLGGERQKTKKNKNKQTNKNLSLELWDCYESPCTLRFPSKPSPACGFSLPFPYAPFPLKARLPKSETEPRRGFTVMQEEAVSFWGGARVNEEDGGRQPGKIGRAHV